MSRSGTKYRGQRKQSRKRTRIICPTGKTVFTTAAAAQTRLRVIQRDGVDRHGNKPQRHYFCDLCRYWHLTSKA